MGQPLTMPIGTVIRVMTLGDWLERGRHLAGMTPHRFTPPPDSVMNMLAARIGRAQMMLDLQQAAAPPGMSQGSIQELLRTVPVQGASALGAIQSLVSRLEVVCAVS